MTMFGTADMSLGISVILRDQFSAQSRTINQSMATMDATARRMQENQLRMQRNFNAAGAMVGIGAINQMRKWVNTGAEFGYTMEYVNSISKKNGVTFDELNGKAKKLGETTMFSAVEVASAMRFMAMAGQDTKEIFNNIDAATNLAGSTMSELGGKGGAADILTNVMKGFQIESSKSTQVADILATATSSANTNLFDLGEAMKYAAATSKDLNVSLEETTAMVMMAGDAGIQGSMAGTAIENMMRYITQAAGEAKSGKRGKILESIGLGPEDLKDSAGNLNTFPTLLEKISGAVQGLGTADKQNVLKELFGVRGKREASLLLRNMEKYSEYLDLLRNGSEGKASGIMDNMMESLQGNIYKLTSAWDTFKISFTEALAPVLFPLLKVLTFLLTTLSAIMNTGFGKFLTILGVGFIVAKTASMAYRAIIATIRLLHTQLGTTMSTASAQTVAGYNSMTAAAARYNAVAGAGMMAGGGFRRTGAGFIGPNGRFITQQAWAQGKYGSGIMGKFMGGRGGRIVNNLSGKMGGVGGRLGGMFKMGGGLGIGIAGMGLEYLGDKVGGTGGKVISTAGKTASYAGTGMMVGSMFGPLGTAIGGLGGAIWGLGSSIWDWATGTDENTEALEENTDSNDRLNQLNQAQFTSFNNMGKERAYQIANGNWSALTDAYHLNPMDLANPFHGNQSNYQFQNSDTRNNDPFYRPDKSSNPQLNIYMDGEKKIQEMIDFEMQYNNIELGMY